MLLYMKQQEIDMSTTETIEAPASIRTIYNIPEQNLAKFEKDIASLSKRSVRLTGEPIRPIIMGFTMEETDNGSKMKIVQVYLEAAAPVVSGWSFVARIDHTNETGNIIRSVPNTGIELPDQYRTCKPNCDHCGVKRYRRDTFVLRCKADGEFQQVGSTCLVDFFGGQDPKKIAKFSEYLGYADEAARQGESRELIHGDPRWISVEEFLTYAAMSVRQDGWVSAGTAYETGKIPTKKLAREAMLRNDETIDADRELAAEAVMWARGLTEMRDRISDYEHNISIIADATYMESRSIGLAASIVGVYWSRQQKRMAEKHNVRAQNVGDFKGVLALMKRPGSLVQYPKIVMGVEVGHATQPVMLAIAGEKSQHCGAIMVTDGGRFGSNVFFGRVSVDGEWVPSNRADPKAQSSVQTLLAALAADPVGTVAAFGHKTGNCAFCNTKLTDETSLKVGYGRTCAKKWGFPYKG